MSSTRDRIRRAWPHLRAALVLLHVAAVLALTLPHPAFVADPSRWHSARGRMELASWGKTLRKLGFQLSDSELEARAWRAAVAYRDWYERYLTPITLYGKYLHAQQSWNMFTHPKKRVGKIWIEVGAPKRFRPVFVSKSSVYTWNEPAFTHNRMRKLFNSITSQRYSQGLDELAMWVAPKLARDFGDSHCRIRLESYVTPTADELRNGAVPKSEFSRAIVLTLEPYR